MISMNCYIFQGIHTAQILRDLAVCVSYEPRNGQIKICLCWTLESPGQSQGDEIEINRIEHQSISLLFWLFVFFFFPLVSSQQQHLSWLLLPC